ncbi:hypothetical protein LK09_13320 [Microbacterium mangrovi]|uniref:Uncharacterized protein n=1 Tax=Microbacterium mangrovi TaxID=1348253 RepID=A0A0B2A180_9MICO|nr:hypothetical protein [Microbacterium mangrovi]KHK97220.1 hypothetical protein LK09_13320 [Microbacterium mangrovi]
MTVQEIEYRGWFGRFTEPRSAKAGREDTPAERRITLWHWSPRGLQDRGRTAGREQERAYGDLQAAFAASDWRR